MGPSLTRLERAYLAGFFDGEGNVGTNLVDQNRNVNPIIQVTQKDPAVLRRLQEMTGLGHLAQFRKTPGREGWIWRIGRRTDVVLFVDLVLPYAHVKREQLLLIREFCGVPHEDQRRRLEIREALLVRAPRPSKYPRPVAA